MQSSTDNIKRFSFNFKTNDSKGRHWHSSEGTAWVTHIHGFQSGSISSSSFCYCAYWKVLVQGSGPWPSYEGTRLKSELLAVA